MVVIIHFSFSIFISFSYGFDKGPLQLKNRIPAFISLLNPSRFSIFLRFYRVILYIVLSNCTINPAVAKDFNDEEIRIK